MFTQNIPVSRPGCSTARISQFPGRAVAQPSCRLPYSHSELSHCFIHDDDDVPAAGPASSSSAPSVVLVVFLVDSSQILLLIPILLYIAWMRMREEEEEVAWRLRRRWR